MQYNISEAHLLFPMITQLHLFDLRVHLKNLPFHRNKYAIQRKYRMEFAKALHLYIRKKKHTKKCFQWSPKKPNSKTDFNQLSTKSLKNPSSEEPIKHQRSIWFNQFWITLLPKEASPINLFKMSHLPETFFLLETYLPKYISNLSSNFY